MNDKKLSGSLTITDGQDKSQIPDVPRPLLEALYATVTNAKDMLSQKRRLASIVEIDDIEQLVAQLDQWSQPYDPISRKIQISVNSFSPEEVQVGVKRSQYGSLEEFRRELPGKTDQISSITLIFDFLARNEKDSLTNQCELTVEIRGGVQRVFYSVSSTNQLGGRLYRNSDEWSASFSIRYSDVIVARGLLGVVDDWYQNLPKREFPALGKFRLFLHRADEFDEYDLTKQLFKSLPWVFGGALASFLKPFVWPYVSGIWIVSFWVMLITICSLLFSLFFSFALKRFDELERGYVVPLINITAGDKRRVKKFSEKIAAKERKFNFWINTIAAGFAVSVLASLLIIFLS